MALTGSISRNSITPTGPAFQVELDEDVISNFIGPSALISAGTTIQIETYIMTYNATNNPIQRQKLIISHTF